VSEDYFGIERESASGLKNILPPGSPKSYRHAKKVGGRSPTKAMDMGTYAHCATLEPHLYNQRYCVWTERKSDNTAAPRKGAKFDAFVLENDGRKALLPSEDESARAMAAAVHAHPIAASILSRGEAEVQVLWTHANGVECKSKIDWLRDDMIVDLKKTVSLARFANLAARQKVPFQLAFYQEAMFRKRGVRLPCKLIVVEEESPHDVAVYSIPPETMAVGARDMKEAFRLLLECHERGEWPGLGAEELSLVLPPWAVEWDEDEEWDMSVKEVA
jgi:hypothetical protein